MGKKSRASKQSQSSQSSQSLPPRASQSQPVLADVLERDPPIAGQAWACFSFLSPEELVKQREHFYFEQFVRQWEASRASRAHHQFLMYLCQRYRLSLEEVDREYTSFLETERDELKSYAVTEEYKTFLEKYQTELDTQFSKDHQFETNVRGLKARGNYETQEEAEMHAKLIRERDPKFDVFVAPVGVWLPWHPDAYKTGRVEYLEEELNQLAHEKIRNEKAARNEFDARVRDSKQRAIADNKKKAETLGLTLTQDIDDEGNLVGVAPSSKPQHLLNRTDTLLSVADVHQELFEGDNIVTGTTDHGQSQLRSGPLATASTASASASATDPPNSPSAT